MVYGCFMVWEAKTEKICSFGGCGGSIGDVGDPEGSGAETLVSNGVKIPENDGVEVLEAAPLYISLCDVMRLDLFRTMVAAKTTPPKASDHDPNYFQPEEIARIGEALESEPIKWKTMVHLFLVTGCRRGEVLGLKRSKVDWENKRYT